MLPIHWVIVKDGQVTQGINEALNRVEADGVIVEGNSFLEHVTADLAIMCARSEGGKIKGSARKALARSDLLYLSSLESRAEIARQQFEKFCVGLNLQLDLSILPIITREDLGSLISKFDRRPRPNRGDQDLRSLLNVNLTAIPVRN